MTTCFLLSRVPRRPENYHNDFQETPAEGLKLPSPLFLGQRQLHMVLQQHTVLQARSSLSSRALALPTAAAQEAWDGLTQFPGSLLSSRQDLHRVLVRQVLITSPAHPDSSTQMCVTGPYVLYVPDMLGQIAPWPE